MRKLLSVRSLVTRFIIALSMCACAAAIAAPATAQQAPATAAALEATLQEIIVTGSRIPVQANITVTSPIAAVTDEDIKLTRYTDTIDVLNLRGIGPQRTLVLVSGRRLGLGEPSTSNSDSDQIPGQSVERIDVVTGGGSATYASDAIAGVVNFIMKSDFQGKGGCRSAGDHRGSARKGAV